MPSNDDLGIHQDRDTDPFGRVVAEVGIEPDATKEWFETELRKRLEAAAAIVWKGTEGNMYIAEFKVEDKCQKVVIHLKNLDDNMWDRAKGIYGLTSGGGVYLGGRFDPYTFLHEWGHWSFGLPDEYSGTGCYFSPRSGSSFSVMVAVITWLPTVSVTR